ncbi:MAG: pyruvate formate lyase family protein, partial [Polyangia bacterium]|nr:pyruvate formate lyase family protein [Polyangia bacterium]
LWLTQVGGLLAYGSPAILAAGRLDQHLVPYYLEDLRAGRITEGEASGLLEELLVKLGTNLMVLPHVGAQTGNELGSDSAAVTVGGLTPEGEDASNPLTFKILEAFENVRSTGNSFAIRLSERSKPELWRAALATFRKTSGAALHNDDVLVLALQRAGYSIAAARSYGVVGCVEPAGDGDTFGCTSGNDVSLVAALEMALLDGRLRILGRRLGPRTGDPRCFRSFEELLRAFERQVAHLIDRVVHAVSLKDRVYRETLPCPLVSSTLSGCVERARDMTAGGADYDFGSVSGRGFGTAVSSLAAVRWAVFETRQVTMAELLDALGRNFAGDKAIGRRLGGGEAHWRRVARGEAQGQRSSGDDAQGKRVAGDEAQGRSSAGEGANGRRLAGDEARGRRSAGDEAQGWRFANGEVQGRSSTGEGANGRRFVNDEALRQTLARRAPAYGADHGAADELARRVAGFFCERVSSYRNIRGGPFRPGFFSYGMHVVEGLVLGATPDGRRAGEPVSNSFSPTNGSEREGLLGVLRSVTRVDHRQVSNGLAVNVKLPPSVLESEEDLDRMVALVKGYFDLGGQELSPNVVSSETLRQAQANPEAYRDLVVRVSGYSACFTDLGRPLQDEIISRTELIP